MEHLIRLVAEFFQSRWEPLVAVAGLLVSVLVLLYQVLYQRREEKRKRRTEGRQLYREAVKIFEQAQNGIPFDPETSERILDADEGDLLGEVVGLCQDALDAHFSEPKVYFLIRQALYRQDRWAEARVAYQKAVKRNKSYLKARYELAVTCEDIGEIREAESEYKKVLLMRASSERERKLQERAEERLEDLRRVVCKKP